MGMVKRNMRQLSLVLCNFDGWLDYESILDTGPVEGYPVVVSPATAKLLQLTERVAMPWPTWNRIESRTSILEQGHSAAHDFLI